MEIDFDELLKDYKPSWKDRARRIRSKIRSAYIGVKDIFFPWNVIKVKNMGRGWHDRDYVLLHAMFTIFVDFIEGEQPFVDWGSKHKQKCHTNIAEMREYVEKYYGENAPVEECGFTRDQMTTRYLTYMELIWMYEWYVTGQWEFDHVANGFSWEKEEEHIKKCDDMLHRIVAWRHHFWT
jgi:hypothetical protein